MTRNLDSFYTTLPEPLDCFEEQELIKKFDESKEILIERNLRLVLHITKRLASSDESIEDLFSIGTIGLIKAVNTFNPEKNIKLSTYAGRCIENEILMYFRKNNERKNYEVSLYQIIVADTEGNSLLLEDILTDDNSIYTTTYVDKTILLKDALKNLNDVEKEIIYLRQKYNLSQKEVGKILKTSQSNISRIERNIINYLKKVLS